MSTVGLGNITRASVKSAFHIFPLWTPPAFCTFSSPVVVVVVVEVLLHMIHHYFALSICPICLRSYFLRLFVCDVCVFEWVCTLHHPIVLATSILHSVLPNLSFIKGFILQPGTNLGPGPTHCCNNEGLLIFDLPYIWSDIYLILQIFDSWFLKYLIFDVSFLLDQDQLQQ